jgi:hypothetical protein
LFGADPAVEDERGAMAAVFVADGMVLAEALRVAGSTLPPAALAGTTLLAEKSPGFAVAAMAGLPPLFFARS